jgi:ubiquinone/menaquinone biosynthesis C-methylase UbiE
MEAMDQTPAAVAQRELQYHERLYSGEAQQHFAKAAVRALRARMVARLLRATGADGSSRVLSLGCGIADLEVLLAKHVGEVVGVELSPKAVEQAREDAERANVRNLRVLTGDFHSVDLSKESFDVVIAIFFLHHLHDTVLEEVPPWTARILRSNGTFYGVDPSHYRLTGKIGSLLVPELMKKYQTEDERELKARQVADLFNRHGYSTKCVPYDFLSTSVAGLFPAWAPGYHAACALDGALTRIPGLRWLGGNFEITARNRRSLN